MKICNCWRTKCLGSPLPRVRDFIMGCSASHKNCTINQIKTGNHPPAFKCHWMPQVHTWLFIASPKHACMNKGLIVVDNGLHHNQPCAWTTKTSGVMEKAMVHRALDFHIEVFGWTYEGIPKEVQKCACLLLLDVIVKICGCWICWIKFQINLLTFMIQSSTHHNGKCVGPQQLHLCHSFDIQ